jgi:hypothetical protein
MGVAHRQGSIEISVAAPGVVNAGNIHRRPMY